MSTQATQYLMWGVKMPYSWAKEYGSQNGDDFYEKFEPFILHHAFSNEIKHHEGVFCLFDGRDGRYIIVGRVLAKAKDGETLGDDGPIEIPELSQIEREFIQSGVKRVFDLDGPFKFWVVTHYS